LAAKIMSNLVVPANDRSNQTFIVDLDGEDFIIDLLWNARAGRWFMTLSNYAGAAIATGIKLCADMPWVAHGSYQLQPAGQLWVIGSTSSGDDPGLKDLGREVYLTYVEEESLG
jgi:hypothetical protein